MFALTIGSFLFFTALVAFMTWRLTRGDDHSTSGGYFLAGRTLTGGYIAGSLLLTNLSTEQLVGLNGSAFSDGLSVIAWEVMAAVSLVVLALIFLPRYLKSGIATVPQFLEERFDAGTRAITSLIFIIAYAAILLPIILYTGATGMAGILDLSSLTGIQSYSTILWGAVWMIGLIGSAYAIFGGLRTVAVSDTINGFGLLIGGVLVVWLGLQEVSSEGVVAAVQELREEHPEKFNSIGGNDQSVPFFTLFTGVLLINLFYWTTNQQIIQRTFGAKSLQEGQKGIIMAGSLKILAPLILVLPGLIAFHLYAFFGEGQFRMKVVEVVAEPDLKAVIVADEEGKQTVLLGEQAETFLNPSPAGEQSTEELPEGQSLVEVVEPGSVVLEDREGNLTARQDADFSKVISPRIKDQAYGMLVRNVLPPWLTGFFAAVIVGAILSSFNSALNSTATLFSLGVYKQFFRQQAEDREVIRAGKFFAAAIALAAMVLAPLLEGQVSIFSYLQEMNGLYFIPILSVVVIGIATKRVPAIGAKLALLIGFSVIAAGYFIVPDLLGGLNNFHFLGIVFASLVAMMLLTGVISPRAESKPAQPPEGVDLTPWKWAWPLGLGLVVVVLLIYGYFADFSVLK